MKKKEEEKKKMYRGGAVEGYPRCGFGAIGAV
jgi:hypothetical protein